MILSWFVRVLVAALGVVLIIVGTATNSSKQVAFIISGIVIIAWVVYAIIRQLASGLRIEAKVEGDDKSVQVLGLFQLNAPWDFIAAVVAFAGIAIPWFVT